MPALPLMRSKHLLPFASLMQAHGEPVERLLRKSGLPEACMSDANALVPVYAAGEFRELAAKRSGWSNIALEATRGLQVENLGDFGKALTQTPTLQRCLSRVCELVAAESSALGVGLETLPNGDVLIRQTRLIRPGEGEWHMTLYVLVLLAKIVQLADRAWTPEVAWIAAAASASRTRAIESLGARPRFGQNCSGLVVPASMLAMPVARSTASDEEIDTERLWSTAPPTSYPAAIREMIRQYAPAGWLTIEEVADLAGASPRTVQRHLSTEKTTFWSLVETTRAEIAGELLERTDATMADIARHVGYQHQGDFTRAFRRWAGVAPSEFRRQRRN
ncbi:MAG: AraC family transcriptional regulator [Deltaproteobacteria bacterium]|nr:AraC family transcriptional regulator [Deltaproteobacteria bacterium]